MWRKGEGIKCEIKVNEGLWPKIWDINTKLILIKGNIK